MDTLEETFGDDRHVYYRDCGDGNTSVYVCPSSPNCIHQLCVVFCMPIIPQQSWGRNNIPITKHITYLNKN